MGYKITIEIRLGPVFAKWEHETGVLLESMDSMNSMFSALGGEIAQYVDLRAWPERVLSESESPS